MYGDPDNERHNGTGRKVSNLFVAETVCIDTYKKSTVKKRGWGLEGFR